MQSKLTRNWVIILVVLAACWLWLYPPGKTLVPGPDLAGGTTLLYEVTIPEGAGTQETMRRVIEVVGRRVDPAGVRNLVFQVESGNRLQILMPHPAPDVIEKRQKYQDLFKGATETNVTRGQLLTALASAPDARNQKRAQLARGDESRKALLDQAAAAHDALEAAKKARLDVKAEAGSDPDIELATNVAQAAAAFDTLAAQVEATNLDPVKLGHILALPTRLQKDEKGQVIPGSGARDEAVKALLEQHPSRKEQVAALIAAYDGYFKEKRPLEDPNDLIRLLRRQGELEFRITAEANEVPNAEELRQTLRERGPRGIAETEPLRWYAVENIENWLSDATESIARTSADPPGRIKAGLRGVLEQAPDVYFAQQHGLIGGTDGKEFYVLLWNTPERSLADRPEQEGWKLTRAGTTMDNLGRPAISFNMNERGSGYLGDLTGNNIKRRMAIALDGRVYSAPSINDQISHSGIITGRFSQQEINDLVNTLASGSLQASLSPEPIEVRSFGPKLGRDNLEKGLKAGYIAAALICLFMTVYYFGAGLVASLALAVNVLFVLGLMASLKATFTLPGIAGIVLTIGMCVDANVLIFERIREEIQRGADILTAIRLGYDKAFSSILDGNLTNLIVCVVLFYTGTADVRGFAVTLSMGVASTLFASLFMTRTLFETYYRRTRARSMPMLPLVFPAIQKALKPNINWIALSRVLLPASVAVTVLSLVFCFARGVDIFDIEFRSGTEVAFDLKPGKTLALDEVRTRVRAQLGQETSVIAVGPTDENHHASAFSVVTPETDSDKVASAVRKAFVGDLDVQPVLSFTGVERTSLQPTADQTEKAPVFAVTGADLGEIIGPAGTSHDVSEYRGGVAIVLDNLQPPVTKEALESRIKAMRLQPEYEEVHFRPFAVVPLSEGPGGVTGAAVVSRDPLVNYFDDAEAWSTTLAASEWKLVRDALQREQSLSKVSRISPAVAHTLANNAIVAVALSLLCIIAYIWFRFGSLSFGLAAIASLVHDVSLALGAVAVSAYIYNHFSGAATALNIIPFKIDMGMVAAILTIIGYSLNDTIVVFDRIRENRGKLATLSPAIVNDSINQTLSRTFLTGGGVLIAVLLLYFIGGEAIRGFAMAMFVGVVAGTYSSIIIAAPLVLFGANMARRREAKAGATKARTVTQH